MADELHEKAPVRIFYTAVEICEIEHGLVNFFDGGASTGRIGRMYPDHLEWRSNVSKRNRHSK